MLVLAHAIGACTPNTFRCPQPTNMWSSAGSKHVCKRLSSANLLSLMWLSRLARLRVALMGS